MKKKRYILLGAGFLCLILYVLLQPSEEEIRINNENEYQEAILQLTQITDEFRKDLKESSTKDEAERIEKALELGWKDHHQAIENGAAKSSEFSSLYGIFETYYELLMKQCRVHIQIYELTDEILNLLNHGLITGVAYNEGLDELLWAYERGEGIDELEKRFTDLKPETEADQMVHPLFADIFSSVSTYQQDYDQLLDLFKEQGYDFELFNQGNKAYLEQIFLGD